jgi:hypothetical protein
MIDERVEERVMQERWTMSQAIGEQLAVEREHFAEILGEEVGRADGEIWREIDKLAEQRKEFERKLAEQRR